MSTPPSFRAASGRNWTQSTTAPTSYPTDAATGDFLLLTLISDPATVVTPTGWTKVTGFPVSNAEELTASVTAFWRIKDASTAAPTVAWGGSNIFNKWDMVAYSGADQTTPINVVSTVTNATTASASPSVASMTTAAANCTIFWWCSNNSGNGTTTTPPSGFTSRVTKQGGTGAGDKAQATAGATGTMTGSMTSDAYVAFAVAVQPPAAGDTTPPTVSLTGAATTRISRQSGKDTSGFTITADEEFVAYEIRSVPSGASPVTAGDLIETATHAATTEKAVDVTDAELEAAVGAAEGNYVIKAFVKDAAGNWSS